MTTRPLLMRGPLVKATLAGEKTVTRRLDLRWLKAKPGDLIWVKETWRTTSGLDGTRPTLIVKASKEAGYSHPWAPIEYVADGARDNWESGFDGHGVPLPGRTRVSIHMPKWAARLWLEVVSVREEPLRDITEDDAKREGVQGPDGKFWACGVDYPDARMAFRYLWESINGATPGARWEDDPSVVRIEFKITDRPSVTP